MDRTISQAQSLFRPEDLIGRTIGQHRVLEKIGEGGMGVVFKAVDTRLERTVALKIINPQALTGEEARNRFIRETRAGAALNHPNICTLYGADEAAGVLFMSMEYVGGPSLRAMIDERPVPLTRALDIAIQTGEGLQAAHRKGIVHRDIKPSNIIIDDCGRVKILDFGLANMLSLSQFTITGTVMGTPAYMSPEQLQAGRADERSDIWSLGIVMYEMLSGRLPFGNQSGQGLAYQIVHQEPEPLTALRSGLPIEIDRIVGKAMAKDPARRYQHVDDLLVDLRALLKRLPDLGLSAPGPTTGTRGFRSSKKIVPWAATMLLVAAALIWRPWRPSAAQADKQVVRFVVNLPAGDSFQGVGIFGSAIDLSPDGQEVIYAARRDKARYLFRRTLADLEPTLIADTKGAVAPILSHDKSWITFAAGREVKRVNAQTGGSSTLGSSEQAARMFDVDVAFFGGCWLSDSDLLLSECTRGLRLFSLDTGRKKVISDVFDSPKPDERQHQFPQVLPGTRWVLFTIWNSPKDSRIAVRSLDTGEQKVLLEPGSYARYSPSGHIVYAWLGDLYAVPFDLHRLEVTGAPVKVLGGVMMNEERGAAYFSLSENGSLAYIQGPFIQSQTRLAWIDTSGRIQDLDLPAPNRGIRLSPDGQAALAARLSDSGSNLEIWVYEFERGISRPLTDQRMDSYWAVWTPDGKRIVFDASDTGLKSLPLFETPADGSGAARSLIRDDGVWFMPYSWSPDGKLLAVQKGTQDNMDIWMLPVGTDPEPYPVLAGPAMEIHPAVSPNGRWLAYASNESKRFEVKVRPLTGDGAIVQVSADGGWEPLWSPDGTVLYYRNLAGTRIMTVPIGPGSVLRVGTSKVLIESGRLAAGWVWGRNYDLSPDGKRFLVISSAP
ncbi:MAG TPA: protein kinase, partial [Acidobacteriota bacterium]|nr:protein kinase [Acidobacteriota bacterium]